MRRHPSRSVVVVQLDHEMLCWAAERISDPDMCNGAFHASTSHRMARHLIISHCLDSTAEEWSATALRIKEYHQFV